MFKFVTKEPYTVTTVTLVSIRGKRALSLQSSLSKELFKFVTKEPYTVTIVTLMSIRGKKALS